MALLRSARSLLIRMTRMAGYNQQRLSGRLSPIESSMSNAERNMEHCDE